MIVRVRQTVVSGRDVFMYVSYHFFFLEMMTKLSSASGRQKVIFSGHFLSLKNVGKYNKEVKKAELFYSLFL